MQVANDRVRSLCLLACGFKFHLHVQNHSTEEKHGDDLQINPRHIASIPSSIKNRSIIFCSETKQLTSAPVCESKCWLPTYPSHQLLCPSFRHPSSVTCSITQSITLRTCPSSALMIFVTLQCAEMCVSFKG